MVVLLVGGGQAVSAADTSNPELKIIEVSESVLTSNTAYDLTITVQNIGTSYGKNASLTLVPQEDGPIVLTEQIGYKNTNYLNLNVPIELTYGVRVQSDATPGLYTMNLEGVMTDEDGNQLAYSETFLVEVVKGSNEVDFEVVPEASTVFNADTETTAEFVLANKGSGTAQDVTIAFSDNQTSGIYATGDADRYLASLDAFDEVAFAMELLLDDDVSGFTPINFDVTYDTGLSIVTKTVTTYVNVAGDTDSTIIIRSIDKSSNSIVPGQKVTYAVVIENTGEVDATYVKVSVSQETAIVPSTQSVVMIDTLPAGSSETIQFTLEATESAVSQNYPIEFTVEYEEAVTSQYSGVYITNDDEDDDDVVSQPRIVVTDFQISNEKIFVGDTFDIDFGVLNTSSLKDVRNLKVIIETATSGTTSEAFMSLNQSNSYFVGDLNMKASSTISMPMKVFANAEGKSYSLSINFEYEDLDGNFYTDNETINIPVYEKTDLTVSDVSVGSSLDNGYTLQVDFYNTGKVDITNMMVDLEGDFASTNSNYYVGDFATGRTDVYDVEILGTQPASITGTIVFTYDDTFGEEETFRKEFTIGQGSGSEESTGARGAGTAGTANASARGGLTNFTEEQRTEMQSMSDEERTAFIESIQNGTVDQVSDSTNLMAYIGGGLVLLIGLVTFIIFRRRRKAD